MSETGYDSLHSAHNGDSALKDSHDNVVKAIRTTSSGLPYGASRYFGVVDAKGNYLNITYYSDIRQEKTNVVCFADIAGSLNNDYFTFSSARDAVDYYVWYNVDAGGTDPVPGGTGIEVALISGDAAAVVALATYNAIVSASIAFEIDLNDTQVLLTTSLKGETTDSTAGTTGFTVTKIQNGITETRAVLTMTYDAKDNLITYEQDIKNLD